MIVIGPESFRESCSPEKWKYDYLLIDENVKDKIRLLCKALISFYGQGDIANAKIVSEYIKELSLSKNEKNFLKQYFKYCNKYNSKYYPKGINHNICFVQMLKKEFGMNDLYYFLDLAYSFFGIKNSGFGGLGGRFSVFPFFYLPESAIHSETFARSNYETIPCEGYDRAFEYHFHFYGKQHCFIAQTAIKCGFYPDGNYLIEIKKTKDLFDFTYALFDPSYGFDEPVMFIDYIPKGQISSYNEIYKDIYEKKEKYAYEMNIPYIRLSSVGSVYIDAKLENALSKKINIPFFCLMHNKDSGSLELIFAKMLCPAITNTVIQSELCNFFIQDLKKVKNFPINNDVEICYISPAMSYPYSYSGNVCNAISKNDLLNFIAANKISLPKISIFNENSLLIWASAIESLKARLSSIMVLDDSYFQQVEDDVSKHDKFISFFENLFFCATDYFPQKDWSSINVFKLKFKDITESTNILKDVLVLSDNADGFIKEDVSVFRAGSRPVCAYDDSGNFIKSFNSIAAASREVGVGSKQISACLNGKQKHAAGYVWKYKS